ncbi:ABC transporter substrate-binding protein [Lutimaribacter sp. EGI FJ00015]|uniref:ABC transporter substrate-binding protein n=1 Tax=Lutimaribacter degradans TaxID=2945989 RepID=A0ACC6A040_9RHOB|nr:ABC transporter substrate-binding protein [Lutimaribacter sp. EGI FJ00013]MCM2563667.1 ABC transporter substrate-binding protein [Lutimaribacter sp. EGI FJ00013]MCO0614850.1 ABC transporter substrate-binding protein [Lutimaribacter sp. EGI FJ00015]MCO0637519.1 ABC transporter substrate-binding protein [Lutimaribacter sp. EGI FJ00014]
MRGDCTSRSEERGAWYRCSSAFFHLFFWLFVSTAALSGQTALADPIRIGGVEYLGDLPTFIAERDGHFARHHADVEVIFSGSGRENLRRLRAGEIDFALMAMTPLVFDALANPVRDGPDSPVILANLSHARPVVHLMLLDVGDVPMDEALRGRTIGVPHGSNADYVLHVIARIAGISESDYSLLDIDPEEMGDALASGRIDAVSVWDPWAGQLRNRFGDRLKEQPDTGRYVSRWLLVTRRETAETDPGHTQDILRAYRDAVVWIQANPEAAFSAHAARISGANSTQRNGEVDLLFDVTLDWSLIASYQQQLVWALTDTRTNDREVPSFMDMVAPAPLAAIAPEAVTIPYIPKDSGRQDK